MDQALSGRRVLVVEDEMLILMTIEGMLADLGCECVTAVATVDKAIALVEVESFDVAMLDVNLNGNKSYPVADALAARGVPFVFSTGYSDHSLKDCPVLRKPFQQKELAAIFCRLLLADRLHET
jgi:CheY-like chemotaxis protein